MRRYRIIGIRTAIAKKRVIRTYRQSPASHSTPKLRRSARLVQLRDAAQQRYAFALANRIGFVFDGFAAANRNGPRTL
jgi:hypothetical protein